MAQERPRALVAGGGGFIGSHLADRLLDQGYEVIGLDNFVTGRRQNVAHLREEPAFRLVEHDLIDALPALPRCDVVFNLASPASPPGYKRFPVETMRVNAEGSRHLLEAAEAWGARYLYASTSEAYGDPLEHPQRETYRGNVSSTGPRSMYDEAKRYGEALAMAFHRSRGVDARIVRIFNTYGPRSDPDDGRLVPNFVMQALRNAPMTIYGDGQQTRSLCFVSDLVGGLVLAATRPEASGEVTNLGNPDEHTVLEFAEIIRGLCGSASEFVFTEPAVGDDPQRRRPDIARARATLGWTPVVGLYEGLSETVRYFREEILRARDAEARRAAVRS